MAACVLPQAAKPRPTELETYYKRSKKELGRGPTVSTRKLFQEAG